MRIYEVIVISACLCGINCRYDGSHNGSPIFAELARQGKAFAVCPEQLGNLPTPRKPAEIVGGSGEDVLLGKASVQTQDGDDVSASFISGAMAVLALVKQLGADTVVFKSRSPSCGAGLIYDGTFSKSLCHGNGVTTALLKQHGIEVINDEDYLSQVHIERNKGVKPV